MKQLMREIEDLYTDLLINSQELAKNRRKTDRLADLLLVRTEIYKSIIHRQTMLLTMSSNVTPIKKAA